METPPKTIVLLAIAAVVLLIVVAFFLGVLRPAEITAKKAFAQGCITFCNEMQAEARATGRRIDAIAIDKARALEDSEFARACSALYPDTAGHVYLCWNRDCCEFELPLP